LVGYLKIALMLLKAAFHEQLAGAGPVDHRLPFLLLMEEHPLDGSEISPAVLEYIYLR
jgi:hypothetical protein